MFTVSRRAVLAAGTAAAAIAAFSTPILAAGDDAAKAETAKLNTWLEDRFTFWVNRSPTMKAYLGIKEDMDKWDDISDARQREDLELTKKDLATLKATFDPAKLDEAGKLSFRLYDYKLSQDIADFRWRNHDYPVNQMFGYQSEIPSFLINIHRVSNVAEAEAYVARLNGVAALMDEVLVGLKDRQTIGVIPPKFVHAHVARDSRNVIKGRPFEAADTDGTLLDDFRGKVNALKIDDAAKAKLIADAEKALLASVKPAFEKLIAFIEAQEKLAGTDDGVWKLPNGDEYYAHMLKYHTTTSMSAKEVHEFGLAEVARIHGEMREIMKKVNFTGDLKAFFKFMQEDPQFFYPQTAEGKAEYVKKAQEIIRDMSARLDDVFITKPKAALIVKQVEPFREQSAGMAFYQGPGAFDGRPGTYYINTFDMKAVGKYEMEALAYHEGIPGHHMQIAIAQELEDVPKFRKFGNDYTAYVEGWGLYCERLPKEMGFYKDPYSDFGRLSMELWRACRLVVDTGIHAPAYKWTREKAIQYLFDNTPGSDTDVINSIERYIVMPGQATAYKVGMEKILNLREGAKKQLGAKFDLRQFHDVVLRSGALPLMVLEENVDAWVKSKA
ncbi:MAG: DUF885 domain-containing protein [Rhodospirillaceae bacterium]|nr:DUF885 domain-containing protein [Rhodospirillaceae bacterium]